MFIGYLALGIVILLAVLFWWGVIQFFIHPPIKIETGKTTRENGRMSIHAPVAQEPYPMQSKADGEIVLAQWYKRYGTEAEKARALALLKLRGYGAA